MNGTHSRVTFPRVVSPGVAMPRFTSHKATFVCDASHGGEAAVMQEVCTYVVNIVSFSKHTQGAEARRTLLLEKTLIMLYHQMYCVCRFADITVSMKST